MALDLNSIAAEIKAIRGAINGEINLSQAANGERAYRDELRSVRDAVDALTRSINPLRHRESDARAAEVRAAQEEVKAACPQCQQWKDVPYAPPHFGHCAHGPHCTRDGCF